MDLSGIADIVTAFCKDNPIIAAAAGVLLLFLLYQKPKLVLGLLGLAFVVALAFYFISDIASIGKTEKGRMINRGVQPQTDSER